MRQLRFNFNNEVDSFEIIQEDDGRIRVPMPGGEEIIYDNIEQFAEFYAQARDVKPEHLKNWTLVENGNVVSFVLRAGTAGVSADEVSESLEQVFRELREGGNFHPLDIERVRRSLDHADDVMSTLAMTDRPELAQAVYDRLDQMGVFTEPEPEPEEEPDTRSDLERYLDEVMEYDHSLAFFGVLMNLGPDAEKDQILTAIEASTIPYTVNSLRELYENAILNAMENGIHVEDRFDAILVISQHIPTKADNTDQVKMINSARMAGRNFLNVVKYTVGHRHIRKDAQILTLDEITDTVHFTQTAGLFMKGNVPITVVYDQAVDGELERERDETQNPDHRQSYEDEYEDEYEDDYEDDYEDETTSFEIDSILR